MSHGMRAPEWICVRHNQLARVSSQQMYLSVSQPYNRCWHRRWWWLCLHCYTIWMPIAEALTADCNSIHAVTSSHYKCWRCQCVKQHTTTADDDVVNKHYLPHIQRCSFSAEQQRTSPTHTHNSCSCYSLRCGKMFATICKWMWRRQVGKIGFLAGDEAKKCESDGQKTSEVESVSNRNTCTRIRIDDAIRYGLLIVGIQHHTRNMFLNIITIIIICNAFRMLYELIYS